MTLSDLRTHLYRLEAVREQIRDQGDAVPVELTDRIEEVELLVSEVFQRWERAERERAALEPASLEWDSEDDAVLEVELAVDD